MTDGTSQGLFIVVAIVIFGIFVVLAYILFEDTLSPALASMFGDTTEKASKRLTKTEVTNNSFELWTLTDRYPDAKPSELIHIDGEIHLHSYGRPAGLNIQKRYFEPNKEYEITFDYQIVSGNVAHLGGHLAISTQTEVFLDGDKINYDWQIPDTEAYPKDNDKHNIRIRFNSHRYNLPITSDTEAATSNRNLYIQPNRSHHSQDNNYHIVFSNLKLEEID